MSSGRGRVWRNSYRADGLVFNGQSANGSTTARDISLLVYVSSDQRRPISMTKCTLQGVSSHSDYRARDN